MNTGKALIPVNRPTTGKNALRYVTRAVRTGWISSAGPFIGSFERAFAKFIGAKEAIAVTNGTAALHLAVAGLGIGPGDEVLVPDLTIMSCAYAVMYTGATPVLVDVEPHTGTIDPTSIEACITKRTRAIMVVHLYGHPADMDPIMKIARAHKLAVIEDAAESHGALYKGAMTGSIGDVGCFSLYANKIVTTGEGGIVVTNNGKLAAHMRILMNLAHSPRLRFWHEETGFNYRMTNLQAAVGLASLEDVAGSIRKKRQMAATYGRLLADIPGLILPSEQPWARSVYWMYAVQVAPDAGISRNAVRKQLFSLGIDTRDFFYPLHEQPVIVRSYGVSKRRFPVASDLSKRGLYIPSGLALTDRQMRQISVALHKVFS